MDRPTDPHRPQPSRRQAMLGAVAVAMLPAAARAATPAGWKTLNFPFRRANGFTVLADGSLQVDGKRAASILYRPIAIDLAQTPRLGWRWRVDSGPPASNLAVRGQDDRALAVIIGFPFDLEQASTMERSQYRAMRLLLGGDTPGRSLHYVWGSGLPRGSIIRPAKTDAHRFVILRPATEPPGIWRSESVDIVADYQRAFGQTPGRAIQLGISSDGDDTGTHVHAAIGDFSWR